MCGTPWANDWANVVSIDFFSMCGFHVLVKGMAWNLRTNCVALLQGSEMSKRVEIMPCREFSESYLEPLKHLKKQPLAKRSK